MGPTGMQWFFGNCQPCKIMSKTMVPILEGGMDWKLSHCQLCLCSPAVLSRLSTDTLDDRVTPNCTGVFLRCQEIIVYFIKNYSIFPS